MFEKEAEEEINKVHWNYSIFKDLAQEYWQKGAEFGYNRANEWHYVKDGLPKETNEYYVYSKQWGVEVRKFFGDVGYFECRKNDVIAWKEIVIPELQESEQK